MTEWVPLCGFERTHEVSNKGNVRRILPCPKIKEVPHILSCVPDKDGYLTVTVQDGAKRSNLKCHRLVASHFIENPENLPQVNHIDGDKENNCADNLEWCSASTNSKHRVNVLGSGTKMYEITHPEGTVEIIKNLGAFARKIGIPRSQLAGVARKNRGTAHGYRVKGPL